jgi:hypothetical protein|eukprot:260007_1
MSTKDLEKDNKGFFKKIRFRRRNRDQTKNIPKDEPISSTRRVIKATRPPSPTTAMSSIVSSSDHDTVDTNASLAGDRLKKNNILPSVQDENLREKTEQWRKERLDATAAIRKENKEKELMQHRRSSASNAKEEGGGQEVDEEKRREEVANMDVSDIFKTRTVHPEHKRKVSSDDHAEKKSKIDEGEVVEEATEGVELVKASWRSKIPAWISIVAPATLVAGFAYAIIAMKSVRKR